MAPMSAATRPLDQLRPGPTNEERPSPSTSLSVTWMGAAPSARAPDRPGSPAGGAFGRWTGARAGRARQALRTAEVRALAVAARLDRTCAEAVLALAKAVEARDPDTSAHAERVRRYSLLLGDAWGLTGEARRSLAYGALLHDIGKIALPDTVLRKPGALDAGEWALMRRHPAIGQKLLAGASFLAPVGAIVACHHERWDGSGYPGGQRGSAIPLPARIVAVADAYDAMTTDRPHRRALSPERAAAEIARGVGSQFDPDLAAVFLRRLPAGAPTPAAVD